MKGQPLTVIGIEQREELNYIVFEPGTERKLMIAASLLDYVPPESTTEPCYLTVEGLRDLLRCMKSESLHDGSA